VAGEAASTGTAMIATLPVILGFQLLLSFLGFDMGNEPKEPLGENPSRAYSNPITESVDTFDFAANRDA
jgi:hypothetical protein